jgi:hypothetical protein
LPANYMQNACLWVEPKMPKLAAIETELEK